MRCGRAARARECWAAPAAIAPVAATVAAIAVEVAMTFEAVGGKRRGRGERAAALEGSERAALAGSVVAMGCGVVCGSMAIEGPPSGVPPIGAA